MHDATSPSPRLRIAVAPGVPSSQLSALLARQRAEEPNVTLAFFEVAGDDLLQGLRAGHYDAGVSLQKTCDPALKAQPLWTENMAVAIPPRFPLLDRAKITIAELQDYPIYRWQAEACPLLDEGLASLVPMDQENIQRVTSFEMMALWVAAGYGVGVSAQSRIEHAHGWGITMRPLADGPYEVVTYLQRPHTQAHSVTERFERRALQVASVGTTCNGQAPRAGEHPTRP
ncbi:TPA: substrate-binding domain-containing protein [Pseudomonas aeruginosa]|uniref:substrate-binding domain-containing protein n=1 Tax=Gammaproteobacteria TaxID=1236 RepID=UPI0006F3B01F|nr:MULTISPECIES: substrate-binding domain-containing protein [Gammaproteobacteria]KQN98377.1 LysR family transcriptional regulator [Stenotrophomonas sp. Leaf70]RPS25289.1 LysR family transcriptional regulator [Pseudomonas aeruginosa]HCF3586566.1 substrate-binding domain-containing protein [Pseudomonas aeruginosa]HCR1521774.1 substrate-binding domain-containing protein [Pseudomonas aeruginosa]